MRKERNLSILQTADQQDLRTEIDRTRSRIESACNHFDEAVDPALIDCCIYELKAAQMRYQFLLRHFKSLEQLIE